MINYYGVIGNDILRIVTEERDKGFLDLNFIDSSIEAKVGNPCMYTIFGSSEIAHWIVSRKDGGDINDGKLVNYPVDELQKWGLIRIGGLLNIKHV